MDSPIKELLVEYVGNKLNPIDDNVTVNMIVEVLAEEFPDLLMLLAEENYLRGYEQAMEDVRKLDPKAVNNVEIKFSEIDQSTEEKLIKHLNKNE